MSCPDNPTKVVPGIDVMACELVQHGRMSRPKTLSSDDLASSGAVTRTCAPPVNPLEAPRMQTIGVIGGSGDMATAEYYRVINKAMNDHLGGKGVR
jgi:hypothetical protein